MRELTTVAKTVAMKENKKSKSNSCNDHNGDENYPALPKELINESLLQKDFIEKIEAWWERNYQWMNLTTTLMPLDKDLSFAFLKRFINERDHELLGHAISFNPYLLQHPEIVRQIITWLDISKLTFYTRDKQYTKFLEPFVKSLIPKKSIKQPVKIKHLASFEKEKNVSIKVIYDELHNAIVKAFEDFKKKENRKPSEADRFRILWTRFNRVTTKYNDINGMLIRRYFTNLAKQSTPSAIARKYLQDFLKQRFNLKVGIDNLKKYTSPTKS